MTPERQLKRNLRTITWTVGATCVAISTLLAIVFLAMRQDQQQIAELQIAQYNEKVDLERVLGYGGMIHNFKNWILRPGEQVYHDRAMESADRALALLDRLQADADTPELAPRFDAMRQTIDAYRTNVDVVSEMHAQGHSAREIDQVVRISDVDALEGLDEVHAFVAERMRVNQMAITQRRMVALVIPCLLSGILLGALALLIRQRARLKQDHDRARLEDMEHFTQVAAHDLRGPLLQISSLLDFARDDLEEVAEDVREQVVFGLDSIAGRVRKLDEMIRAVFRYLQVEGAAQQIERIDLRRMAEDIKALHIPVGATMYIEGVLPKIRAQKVELEIVLRNLVSNAVKHHPANRPSVVLRYFQDGGTHRFEVEDDGVGIPERDTENVFRMFWTAKGHQNSETVSGLGLALVRRIVTRWNGEITAGNAPGGGAIFRFTMPVHRADRVQTTTFSASWLPTPNTRL